MKINNNKELFCQKYWHNLLKKDKEIPNVGRFDFADANLELIGFDNYYSSNGKLTKLIKDTDITQKLLAKPLKNDITLWRGIANPKNYIEKPSKQLTNLFNKCSKLKKGDTFYMPEYSFWTTDSQIALRYANNNGIIYELKVPKGTKIMQKIFPIFQRASKFLCINNKKKFIDENTKVHYIKLKMLPRDIEL